MEKIVPTAATLRKKRKLLQTQTAQLNISSPLRSKRRSKTEVTGQNAAVRLVHRRMSLMRLNPRAEKTGIGLPPEGKTEILTTPASLGQGRRVEDARPPVGVTLGIVGVEVIAEKGSYHRGGHGVWKVGGDSGQSQVAP